MGFHKDLNGWLYLIENKELGFRKIGMTNNIVDRLRRFGPDWKVVFVIFDNGHMISILEELSHLYVVKKSRKLRRLLKGQIKHSGYTETFFSKGSPSNKNLYRFVTRARQQLRDN